MSSPNRKQCQNIHAPKKLFLSYARHDIDSRPRSDTKQVSSAVNDKPSENGTKSMLNALQDVPLGLTVGQSAVNPWDCIEGIDFHPEIGSTKIMPQDDQSIEHFPAFVSQHSAFKSELSSVLPQYKSASNTSNVICQSAPSMPAYDRLDALSDDGQHYTHSINRASNLSMEVLASESSLSLEDISYITTSPHIPDHIKRIVLLASVSSHIEHDQGKTEIMAGNSVDPDWNQSNSSNIYSNVSSLTSSKMEGDLSKIDSSPDLLPCSKNHNQQFLPLSQHTQYPVPRNRPRLWKGRSGESSITCKTFTPSDLSTEPMFVLSNASSTEFDSSSVTDISSTSNSFELYDRTPSVSDSGFRSDCIPIQLSQPCLEKRDNNGPSFLKSGFSSFLSDNTNNADMLQFSDRNSLSSALALNNDSNVIENLSSKEAAVPVSCSIPRADLIEDCDISSSVVDAACKKDDSILINENTDMQFESCNVSEVQVKEEMEIGSTDTSTIAPEKRNRSRIREKKHGRGFLSDLECQVCGDTAAGFYCGAYICEACKKFFLRACKQGHVKYICFKDKNCSVTKENRIRCQYCRYQKCLRLNMYCPGSHQNNASDASVSSIPCRVCGAPSSGFHFGVLTCEGCKGFFRRMAKERDLQHYQCTKNGLCEVNTATRNLCKACRYSKCLKVGMSTEGSRIGRQPNTVKRAICLELQQKLQDSSENSKNDCYPATREIVGFSCEKDSDEPTFHYLENRPNCMQFVSTIDNAAKELSHLHHQEKGSVKIPPLDVDTPAGLWDAMMTNFEHHAHCVIHFAKKVPGFRAIDLQEQVKLVQGSIYPIVIITLAQHYDLENGSYNYFNFTKAEEEHILTTFPMLAILQHHFEHVGQIVKIFKFDQVEFAIVSAILLLSGDDGVITNIQVRDNQKRLVSCLQEYEEKNYTNGLTRFGILLLRLGELSVINQQHKQAITVLLSKHSYLNVSQLYKELILKD